MELKTPVIGAIVIVALVMFGISVSYGGLNNGPEVSVAEVAPILSTPAPAGPAEASPSTRPPEPTSTPQPSTPAAPQVIYIQATPQIIYVQVPPAANQEPARSVAAPEHAATQTLAAPPCAFLTGQAMLTSWLSSHPEHYAELSRCNLATPTPLVVLQTVVVPGPTFTPTPVPTATPVLVRGQVVVNFAGAATPRPTVAKEFAVQPGASAWDAIKQAVGVENLTYRDFGPGLGIFITGFYGVVPAGNQFWEFLVNGASSSVGVSGYIVKGGDVLEFRISSF